MQCVLVGNYGVGNFGDEALKKYFLRRFPDVKWNVLSAHPTSTEYARLPLGIRSFISFSWMRTLLVIRKSDAVVFGGGTLFTDIESVRACFLWWWHAFWARVLGTPSVFAFQGIGPFKTRLGEYLTRSAMVRSHYICVRDKASYERVKSWKLNTEVVQAFDPVVLLINKRNKTDIGTNNVFICIPRDNSGYIFTKKALEINNSLTNSTVKIVSLKNDDIREQKYCTELKAALSADDVVPVTSLSDLENILVGATLVLSERFHGSLLSLALGIPLEVVSQEDGDKHAALESLSHENMSRAVAMAQSGEVTLRAALEGDS